MKRQAGIAHVLVIVAIILIAAAGFLLYKSLSLEKASNSLSEPVTISPFQLSPFVSHEESQETICKNSTSKYITNLCENYVSIAENDKQSIDEVIAILRQANNDETLTDYDKFLTMKLVFALLPKVKDGLTLIPEALAQDFPFEPGMTQEEYADILAEDLATVQKNCPGEGYENYVLNYFCAVHSWVDDEKQPIYSKEYAEVGGPCAFSDAGAVERYKVYSITESKMSSEQNFIDGSGVNSQIVCNFTCGSYNCPKLEGTLVNPSCSGDGSKSIYVKHPDGELGTSEILSIGETASVECKERRYDYFEKPDGTTGIDEVRDCKLVGAGERTERYDETTGKWNTYTTYCCSCERQVRSDPFISIYDYSEPDFSGGDLLARLMDVAKRKVEDVAQTPAPADNTPPPSTPTPTEPPEDNTPPPAYDSGELVLVLVIGGEHYPFDQFVLTDPDVCDERHWHSNSPVTSLEGISMEDPAPNACGFGKESEIPVIEVEG